MAKAKQTDLRAAVDAADFRRSQSAMSQWEADDPARAAEFWDHVEYARSRGMGWGPLLELWNDLRPAVPLKGQAIQRYYKARSKHDQRSA